jgi:hypothetical protein
VEKKEEFHYYLDAQKKETSNAHLTGAQIKASGPVPAEYQLYEEEEGDNPDKAIADSETQSLAGKTKHFYAIPPATFG